MELILLEKVLNLGDLGDKVKVKPGYGRNFLVPQGKAIPATKANLAEFEARRAELEKAAMAKLSTAEDRLKALEGFEMTLTANAAEEGKLYGSIGPREIADAVTAQATPFSSTAEVCTVEADAHLLSRVVSVATSSSSRTPTGTASSSSTSTVPMPATSRASRHSSTWCAAGNRGARSAPNRPCRTRRTRRPPVGSGWMGRTRTEPWRWSWLGRSKATFSPVWPREMR